MTLAVEYLKITDLKNYERNARTHSPEQIQQVAASIQEFGFTNPVLVDENNTLIAGHGRTAAASSLSMDEVPAIRLSNLNESQKKALRIADNQLALNAGWDFEMLAAELHELELEEYSLDLLGFDDEFMEGLLDGGLLEDEGEQDDPAEDTEASDPPEQPVTVMGDLWVLGKHRLMCGDSTSTESVEQLLSHPKAAMVFTDPPYNMDFTGGLHGDGSKSFNATHGGIKNDKMSQAEADQFFDDINTVIKMLCAGPFYITFYRLGIYEYWKSLDRVGLKVRSLVIWNKGHHTLSNSDYKSTYEPIFYGWVDDHHFFYGGKNGRDIWDIARTRKNDLHPTMKPVDLVEKAIHDGSKRGDIVLDLFGGSGTTLIACENTNRKARLMELDPKYCDVIVKRWQEHTGKQAILESTGQTFAELEAIRKPEIVQGGHNSCQL